MTKFCAFIPSRKTNDQYQKQKENDLMHEHLTQQP